MRPKLRNALVILSLAVAGLACSKGAALAVPVDPAKGAIYMNGASQKPPLPVSAEDGKALAERLNAKRGWKPSVYAWKSYADATLAFTGSQTVFDINADGRIYSITKGQSQSAEVQDLKLSGELLTQLETIAKKGGQ